MNFAVPLVRTALNSSSVVAPRLAGRGAYALFCNPLSRGRLRSCERVVHEQAFVESLSVNGKRVTSYRWGDGAKPVLMLHGWQSRGSRWASFVPRLQALGLSPVTFDAPGHGDSGGRATTILEYRTIIEELHDRYGPFDSVLAHSFGVTCAFLALRGNVKARRLVAVSGVCEFGYLFDEFVGQLELHPRVRQNLRRRIEDQLFPAETDIWERFSASHRPADITIPILVIHDREDPTVRFAQAHKIMETYPDQVTLVTPTNLGHRKILDAPTVIDTAMEFLGKHAQVARSTARGGDLSSRPTHVTLNDP